MSTPPGDDRSPAASGPDPAPPVRWRWAWWLLAWASFCTGIVGLFVPGLPTTVFILIAAWAATRGSARLRHRLVSHPRFGPVIADWENHGAISRRGKKMASLAMAVCAVIVLVVVRTPWVWGVSIGSMAAVALWLWRRPEPPAR